MLSKQRALQSSGTFSNLASALQNDNGTALSSTKILKERPNGGADTKKGPWLCTCVCTDMCEFNKTQANSNCSKPNAERTPKLKCQRIKCQVPKQKFQMSNAKCQMPNVKCQMPNVKCQMTNAKCQMSNAKCSMPMPVHAMSSPP